MSAAPDADALPDYDFWLFDLDGTLVDAEWRYARKVLDEVGDRMGCRFTDETAYLLWHGIGDARTEILGRKGIGLERFWATFDEVDDPQSRAEATFLYDDAAVLNECDVPLGIVTHCPREVTDAVLDTLGIGDWFDAVVCCSAEVGMKPSPEPVRTAMSGLDGDPSDDAVLVGDSTHDIEAARNAGIDAVHVERYGRRNRSCCSLSDRCVETLGELGGGGITAVARRTPAERPPLTRPRTATDVTPCPTRSRPE